MSEYPEHDKLQLVQEESQAIGEFVDWASGQGYSMMRYDDRGWAPPIGDLLAEYFEIDLNKLEAEKRVMLKIQGEANRR